MLCLQDQDTVGDPVFLDLWTIVHFVSGVAAYYVLVALTGSQGLGFLVWTAIHLAYEAKDFWVAHLGPSASVNSINSLGNSVCDQLAAAFGYGLAVALATSPRPGLLQALAALIYWLSSGAAARLITGEDSPE
jgi:hypothetical protein